MTAKAKPTASCIPSLVASAIAERSTELALAVAEASKLLSNFNGHGGIYSLYRESGSAALVMLTTQNYKEAMALVRAVHQQIDHESSIWEESRKRCKALRKCVDAHEGLTELLGQLEEFVDAANAALVDAEEALKAKRKRSSKKKA